jgi:hypothetical protein
VVISMRDLLAPSDEPMTVQPVDGEVVVLGPDAMAIAMTPSAARISGERLIEAADRALGGAPNEDET